jgi:hypothetical protein
MGVASCPGEPGLELVAAAGSASEHVQFHTQVQPARGALAGAVRHAPVQFHTQVQVSGAPGALAPLGDAPVPGALARSAVALAPGALASLGEAVTPGARALSPRTLAAKVATSSSEAFAPGAAAPSSETLAAGAETACLAGAAASSWAAGLWSVVAAAAGVATAS